MIRLKDIIVEGWHDNARLEAYSEYHNDYTRFWFFRNGIFAGEIQGISSSGYMSGFAVLRSLQGTGIGKAMLNYAFEKTGLPQISFGSSAHQFYHQLGGERKGGFGFIIKKEKLKPSPITFTEIDEKTKNQYLANLKKQTGRSPRLDFWPSRN